MDGSVQLTFDMLLKEAAENAHAEETNGLRRDAIIGVRRDPVGAMPTSPAPSVGAMPSSPVPAPAPAPARALTLDALIATKIDTTVWIEGHRQPWDRDDDNEILRFFDLFPADYIWTGIPIGTKIRVLHFKYEYKGTAYRQSRTELFYGSDWRAWTSRPTAEQMEALPWQERRTP